jgi:DNA-binding NtrC family response regulator
MKHPDFSILLADDEPSVCFSISAVLKVFGINNVMQCTESSQIMSMVKENDIEIILLDLIMPGIKGEQILEEIKKEHPEKIVIVVTGNDNLKTAVDCMKKGAFDYIVKPVDENLLIQSVNRAIDLQDLRRENENLSKYIKENSLNNPEAFSDIISNDDKIKGLFQYSEAISKSSQPVLITGETGTGKELFAKAIHTLSGRSGKFIAVNVSGLDSNMFSDSLFGHVKGAFTGALNIRKGLVEEAREGTLFLDEIGDLDAINQVKLLRLLQEHEYSPLGSDETKYTDAKVVVATHKDLKTLVNENSFRKDLYYRLHTHHIHLPPLKERKEDIPLLLDYYMGKAATELNKKKPSYPLELITHIKNYDFPGNIRELIAMVYDAVAGHRSKMLSLDSFKNNIREKEQIENHSFCGSCCDSENIFSSLEKLPELKESSKMLIDEAMRRSDNNQSVASGILGISQQALSKRLKKTDAL